jgi:acyl-CoA synthetase (AMP-forming)/AMP-acid ligase II
VETIVHCGDTETPAGSVGYESLIEGHEPVEDTRTGGDALFGIFYTGGTTGHPKGVMLSHDNMLASAMGALSTGSFLSAGSRLLHAAPMFHLADIMACAAACVGGGTHVIIPSFTPAGVIDAISRHRVTDALLVPTMIQMLVDDADMADADISSMSGIIYGASSMPEALLNRAVAAFPDAGFTQAYGMTELSPVATLLLPEDHHDPVRRTSAGKAAPHAEVRIVDLDGVEVPRGEVGEVVVRGDHVMVGYWNRPEDTANAVRDGWMHTGDGGRMDEHGYVFIVDRLKDMIISGGENVYSAEVENALAKHPAVASCAVIGVPDKHWGERVHAVVVLAPGAEYPTEQEIQEHCRTLLAGYKTPRTVTFVGELPLSGAGKILKRELRSTTWAD